MMHQTAFIRHEVFTPPLFDRLTLQGTCFLEEEELKASVCQELQHVLNTRVVARTPSPLGADEEPQAGYMLPDYFGLQDFVALYVEDPLAWEVLERDLERACATYEPRLQNLEVTLEKEPHTSHRLRCTVKGSLKLGHKTVPVVFPLAIDTHPSHRL
jgi:type VI secretion system lysozyme-like protein